MKIKIEENHPAKYVCGFQGEAEEKIKSIVFKKKKMFRRALAIIDENIEKHIKLSKAL